MGKVEHFEIPADDPDRALNFYKRVFNWELNPVPGVEYVRLLTLRVDHEAISKRPFEVNGAIIKRNSNVRGPVVVTISVADMDDTLKKIADEGGSVVVSKTEFGKRG